ncbi:MAG TPA: S41 family peptidase [Rhodanobacteraceae bacterium]
MKQLLAVPFAMLLAGAGPMCAAVGAPAEHGASADDTGLTVSPASITSGNDYWKKLGVTLPNGGFILAHPWSSPWSGRSLIVPAAWFKQAFDTTRAHVKSATPLLIDTADLRKDLPILHMVMEKNYSGWETAAKRGWNWNAWFGDWDRTLAGYGEKSIPDQQAFAPWFALERFQIDSHSGPEVPSRFGSIVVSRSAVLAHVPSAACTSLRLADGSLHPLSIDDKAQQPHTVEYWDGKTLRPGSYLVYPSSLGVADDIDCGDQRIALTTFWNGYEAFGKPAPAMSGSVTALSGGKRGLAVYNTPAPGIGYLRLASFDDAGDAALTQLLPHLPASAGHERLLIVDLRGNDGGGAPIEALSRWIPLKQLSPRFTQIGKRSCLYPGLWFNQAQVLSLGVKHASTKDMRETVSYYARGIGAPATMDCPVSFQTSTGKWMYAQHHFVRDWRGHRPRLLVLVDQGCGSDCEAMTWLLAQLPGTVIAGRNTVGVTGFAQPGFLLLPHTHIAFQLATSRTDAYGDGRSEDGYGLDVDVALTTAADWSARSVLALATQLEGGAPTALR